MPVDRITELVQEGLRRKLCGDPAGAADAWGQALALDPGNNRARAYLDALVASGAVPPVQENAFAGPASVGKSALVGLTPSPFGPSDSPLPSPGPAAPDLLPLPGSGSSPVGLEMPWLVEAKPPAASPAKVSGGPPAAQPPGVAKPSPWVRHDVEPDPSLGSPTMVFGAMHPRPAGALAPGSLAPGAAMSRAASSAAPGVSDAEEGARSTLVFGAGMAPPAAQPKSASPAPSAPSAAPRALASPFAPSRPSSPFTPSGPASPFSPTGLASPLQPARPSPVSSAAGPAAARLPLAAGPQPVPEPAREDDGIGRLLQMAADLLDLDDHSGALEAAEKVLALDPANPTARALASSCQSTLQSMFESKLGDLSAVPRVLMRQDEIVWLSLDHRAGFLLSMIDGQSCYEDLFALSSMSRLDTARILAKLLQDRVVG